MFSQDFNAELLCLCQLAFEATSLIPVVGAFLNIGSKVLTKRAKKQIEQPTNDLQDIKNKIIKKMREEDLKIIVSIDDIKFL